MFVSIITMSRKCRSEEGSQRVRHNLVTEQQQQWSIHNRYGEFRT